MLTFCSPARRHASAVLSALIMLAAFSVEAAAQQGGNRGGGRDRGTADPDNTAPLLVLTNSDFTLATGQNFTYDATLNETAFEDSDGDDLRYRIDITPAMAGVTARRGTLSGAPATAGVYLVEVTARDNRGGSASDNFLITVTGDDIDAADVELMALAGLNLPATPFSYSAANLPGYFRRGNTAERDNTPDDNPVTNWGATLGRVLFYDVKLSANDTISCASCHQQDKGFSDPAQFSTGFDGGLTARHSMSLANARFYERGRFFWDERAETLEDQVLMPIQDAVEMGMTLTELEVKLQATDYYPVLFEAAFGDDTVTSDRIARALAQFIRAIVSTDSKFDQALQTENGFETLFTAQEELGRQLFGGGDDDAGIRSLGCGRCHGSRAHSSDDIHNNGLDATVTGDDGAGDKRFKSPSLRNIAASAPYMHDGRFATLEEVIEFYDSGVQDHPELDNRLTGRRGQPRQLNMTDEEKAALLAFLHTLTDDTLMTDVRFSDPFIEAEN